MQPPPRQVQGRHIKVPLPLLRLRHLLEASKGGPTRRQRVGPRATEGAMGEATDVTEGRRTGGDTVAGE